MKSIAKQRLPHIVGIDKASPAGDSTALVFCRKEGETIIITHIGVIMHGKENEFIKKTINRVLTECYQFQRDLGHYTKMKHELQECLYLLDHHKLLPVVGGNLPQGGDETTLLERVLKMAEETKDKIDAIYAEIKKVVGSSGNTDQITTKVMGQVQPLLDAAQAREDKLEQAVLNMAKHLANDDTEAAQAVAVAAVPAAADVVADEGAGAGSDAGTGDGTGTDAGANATADAGNAS